MQHRTDPLFDYYQQLVDSGTKPNLAKVSLARKVAAISLSMWKFGKAYDPKQVNQSES